MLVGGGGGCFLAKTGRKTVGMAGGEVCGACFDAASAYDGVLAFLDCGMLNVNPLPGFAKVALSSLRAVSMLFRRFSTRSGILHPNVLVPVRARLIWLSSSSPVNKLRRVEGMFDDCSTRSRTVAARVFMSAAVSDPKDEIRSPPFFGRRMDSSISL